MTRAIGFAFASLHSRPRFKLNASLRFTHTEAFCRSASLRSFRYVLRSTLLQARALVLAFRFASFGVGKRAATAPLRSSSSVSVALPCHLPFAQTIRKAAQKPIAIAQHSAGKHPAGKALNTLALSELILFSLRRALSAATALLARAAPLQGVRGDAKYAQPALTLQVGMPSAERAEHSPHFWIQKNERKSNALPTIF